MPSRPENVRSLTATIRAVRQRAEEEALLPESVLGEDRSYQYEHRWTQDQPHPPNPHAFLPVYKTIHLCVSQVYRPLTIED